MLWEEPYGSTDKHEITVWGKEISTNVRQLKFENLSGKFLGGVIGHRIYLLPLRQWHELQKMDKAVQHTSLVNGKKFQFYNFYRHFTDMLGMVASGLSQGSLGKPWTMSIYLKTDNKWHYLDHGNGVAVRCYEMGSILECASTNGKDCQWGKYGIRESYAYIPEDEVFSPKPAHAQCPGWATKDGSDPCSVLNCYITYDAEMDIAASLEENADQEIEMQANEYWAYKNKISFVLLLIGIGVVYMTISNYYRSKQMQSFETTLLLEEEI